MKPFDIQRISKAAAIVVNAMARSGLALAPPFLRVALALPFLRSGLTRWDRFPTISIGTTYLFEEVFKLHLFGHTVGLPFPDTTAYVVACAELIFPIMLLIGLGTRFAAFSLLLMTGIIQLTVPHGWANFHLYWASIALAILAIGPGPVSLDRLLSHINNRRADITP